MNEDLMWSIMGTGLATVFLCLLSLILMVRVLRAILEGRARRHGEAELPRPAPGTVAAQTGKGELVAAITAAVAAASGRPASSFRIASIEASPETTPVWGRVDRIPGPAAGGRR